MDNYIGVVGKLFSREDLSKPENRANQWLLASCCADRIFRARLLSRFKLDEGSILRPVQLGNCRPDLTVFLRGNPVAVVECEVGGRDLPQEAQFQKDIGLPQHWVVGTHPREGDVTWAEIRKLAEDRRTSAGDDQVNVALDLLIGAIKDIEGARPPKPRWLTVPDELPEPFRSNAAFLPLLELAEEKKVGAWTVAEGSASLRLLQPASALRTAASGLGLAMTQVRWPGIVQLPTADHLRGCLAPDLGEWVDRWAELMGEIAPIATGQGRKPRLAPDEIGAHASKMAGIWSELAARLRSRLP